MLNVVRPSVQNFAPVSEQPKLRLEILAKTKPPPLKGTICRISELLRQENVSTRELARVVGCDPLLAARLLRLANSCFYAQITQITTLQRALDTIGTKALYDLIMLGAVSDSFPLDTRNSFIGCTMWEHSLAVGLVSREISRLFNLRGTEEAFVCGLLHDIGKIMMFREDPAKFAMLSEKESVKDLLATEVHAFGYDHSEVGAYIAQHWHLPESVCDIIRHHHIPIKSQTSLVMANIVNAADFIANANGYGLCRRIDEQSTGPESLSFLNLAKDKRNELWESVQDALAEVIDAYS